jgi:hypothetical protein
MKYIRGCLRVLLILILFNLVTVQASWSDSQKEVKNKVKEIEVTVQKADKEQARFQEYINLTVSGLERLLEKAKNNNKNIIPYINGFPLKGLKAEPVDKDTLRFCLTRTPESKDTWKALLYHREHFSWINVSLSVGLEGEHQEKTGVNDFQIKLIKKPWFIFSSVCGLFILVLLLWLCKGSEILRNFGPEPEGGKKRTFSLALSQMAAWFVVIISAFVLIWLTTGELNTLTDSVLYLMGISASTLVAAAVIDKSKLTESQNKNVTLMAEKESLNEKVTKLTEPSNLKENITLTTQITTTNTRLKEIDKELKNLPATDKGPATKNWFIDVLSDVNGISLHRFQILVWTFVLIVIFIADVYNYLTMPDFSATLLGLMGISSGTYIGFKLPEQNIQP